MNILVLNLGLKNLRCIAFRQDGTVLAQHALPVRTFISNEAVEQDPNEWLQKSWQVIRHVTREMGTEANSVAHLTVTTSASCMVPVDAQGAPLRNSILVSDTRAAEQARMLTHTVEFQPIQSETGQKSSPDLMIPKIMWLRRHEPEVFASAAYFLNAGDFLNFHLTGRFVTDPNNALKYHYVLSRGAYPDDLLDSLGMDSKTLPAVFPPGTTIGPVLASVAEELGFPASCSVVLATYDALAAVTGTGAFDIGQAVDVSGTVTSFRLVTDHHLFDPQQRIYVTPHIAKGQWLAGGSTNLGGGAVEWLRQLLFKNCEDPYGDIEKASAGQSPCPGGLIFLPHLLGERTPIWNADCRGVFFGLNRAHGSKQIVRAVLEGIGFSVRHIVEVLRGFNLKLESVTASGGLTRLHSVNQLKADILGIPVRTLRNFETTAIGAALIALTGAGIFKDPAEGFEQFCKVERIYEPDEERHRIYEEYFALYCQVYESLRGAYSSRAALLARLRQKGIDELVLTENL